MSAYVIAHATIKDPEKLKEYRAIAGPSVKAAGGEFVTAAHVTDVLVGSHEHQRTVIIRNRRKADIAARMSHVGGTTEVSRERWRVRS